MRLREIRGIQTKSPTALVTPAAAGEQNETTDIVYLYRFWSIAKLTLLLHKLNLYKLF